MLDPSDRISVALQVLQRRGLRLDVEAIGAVLADVHGDVIARRGVVRGLGVVCDSEVCSVWAGIDDVRRQGARALLVEQDMADLLVRPLQPGL